MIKGIGIDVVQISRIKRALEKGRGHLLSRIFTKQEIDSCETGKETIQKYAARFAAKEAFMKALGTGWAQGVTWKDIEVISEQGKPPQIKLNGKALEIYRKMGSARIHLSLSHEGMVASALVIVES